MEFPNFYFGIFKPGIKEEGNQLVKSYDFSKIFTAIADFPWVTQTKTMVFLKSAVA